MSTLKIEGHINENHWDKCIHHPLQSYAWGTFREQTGIQVLRVGQYEQSTLINGYQITLHPLPKLPYVIGYIPKSAIVTTQLVDFLKAYGKKHKVIFFQIEPNSTIQESEHLPLLPSHHPLFTKYTFSLDIAQTPEKMLKHMQSKTRYNIKVAKKHGVEIKEDNSKEAFNEYLRLSQETTQRQGFYAHTQEYHKKMWATLNPKGLATLWTATYQQQVLAAWIIFKWKDTIYYPYGASSRVNRNVMAPTLLLWEIAQWGHTHGYKYFDLWGALGPNPDEHDPWYGFHKFKQGFNPQLIEFIGSYDIVCNPFLYKLYCLADTLRWKIISKK